MFNMINLYSPRNLKTEFYNAPHKEGEDILKLYELSFSDDEDIFQVKSNGKSQTCKFRTDRIFYDGVALNNKLSESKPVVNVEYKYFSNKKFKERNRLDKLYKDYAEKIKIENLLTKNDKKIRKVDFDREKEGKPEQFNLEGILRLDTREETRQDTQINTKQNTQINSQKDHKIQNNTHLSSQVDTRLETRINTRVDTKHSNKVEAVKLKIMKKPKITTNYTKPKIYMETKPRKPVIFPPVPNLKYNEEFINREYHLNKELMVIAGKSNLHNAMKLDNYSTKVRNYTQDLNKISTFTKLNYTPKNVWEL